MLQAELQWKQREIEGLHAQINELRAKLQQKSGDGGRNKDQKREASASDEVRMCKANQKKKDKKTEELECKSKETEEAAKNTEEMKTTLQEKEKVIVTLKSQLEEISPTDDNFRKYLKDAADTTKIRYLKLKPMREKECEHRQKDCQDKRNNHFKQYRKGRKETMKKQKPVIQLRGQGDLTVALEAGPEQVCVEKEDLEAIISKLEEDIRGLNEELSKAEQEISPPDITGKMNETGNSSVSEGSEKKFNEEEMNELRQQVKTLEEELDEARKMYEEFENEMETKAAVASTTEDNRKIKYSTSRKIGKWKVKWQQRKERCLKFSYWSNRCTEQGKIISRMKQRNMLYKVRQKLILKSHTCSGL